MTPPDGAGDAAGGIARSADRIPLPVPRWARLAPDAVAIRWQGGSITYAELDHRADAWAERLVQSGVRAGDRVAAWMPNRPLAVALVHAVARLGAVIVPLNTRLTAREVGQQLARTTPRVMIADPSLAERVRELDTEDVPGMAVLVVAPGVGVSPDEATTGDAAVDRLTVGDVPADGTKVGDATVDRVTAGGSALGETSVRDAVRTDRPQAIVHTSGTTGRAKGVVLTWGNQVWSATGSSIRLGSESGTRWLATLPWFHVGGLAIILRCAWQGGTVVLHPGFDPEAVDRALDEEALTALSVVSTMLARLLEVRGDRGAPPTLRAVLVGGGPAAPALLERAADLGFPLAPTYGLTEAASQVATCAPGWRPEDGLAAPPMPFTEVRIVDDAGLPVADREPGRIAVRGPTVMAGYWDDAEATAEVLDDEGWLQTGDRGHLDPRGRLVVLGRADDVIVSGGENVDPVEVEAVLDAHPRVAESCVFGVDDPEWGRRVVAALVLRKPTGESHRMSDEDGSRDRVIEAIDERDADSGPAEDSNDQLVASLARHTRAHLAGYKVPREMRIVESLPRTASGKVRRDAVRRAWSDAPVAFG